MSTIAGSDPDILAVGPFGAAVGQHLRAMLPTGSTDGVLVLAAWHPVPGLYRQVEHAAYERGVPWIAAVMEHPWLRIGPVVVPGAGPCHRCFERRRQQHAPAGRIDRAVERHYEMSDEAGPHGFLPATVWLTAGLLADMIGRLQQHRDGEAGRIRMINILTQQLTAGRTVGIHGCPRCGLRRDEARRSSDRLRTSLQEALRWTN